MANENDRPIINAGVDNIIATATDIKNDLSTLRPLLRNMLFAAYATDKIENAPIATFPDGADDVPMKSATFAIQPVQDLHGYDSPWPAGGGKNLYRDTFNGWTKPTDYWIYPISLPEGTYKLSATLRTGKTAVTGAVVAFAKSGTKYADFDNFVLALDTDGTIKSASPVTITSSDSPVLAFFGTKELFYAVMDAYEVQLELGSTATAWTPYANECPITGFTGAEITAKGVNLWDEEWEVGTYDGSGNPSSANDRIRTKNYIPVRGGATYSFVAPSGVVCYWYDSIKTFISTNNVSANATYTVPTTACYLRFRMGTVYGTTYNNDISINYPSTDTEYHASVGVTNDITWQDAAGTVYGGALEYLGGDMWRLTKTMQSGDMGDLTWTYDTTTLSVPVFYSSNFNPSKKLGSDNMVSPCYKTVNTRGYLVNNDFALAPWNNTNSGHIGVRDSRYTDAAAFTTAVTGTQLVYELATPVVYDLTGEELATVLGNNNVFSNTGDVTELVYRADTALFVEKKLAE